MHKKTMYLLKVYWIYINKYNSQYEKSNEKYKGEYVETR